MNMTHKQALKELANARRLLVLERRRNEILKDAAAKVVMRWESDRLADAVRELNSVVETGLPIQIVT